MNLTKIIDLLVSEDKSNIELACNLIVSQSISFELLKNELKSFNRDNIYFNVNYTQNYFSCNCYELNNGFNKYRKVFKDRYVILFEFMGENLVYKIFY